MTLKVESKIHAQAIVASETGTAHGSRRSILTARFPKKVASRTLAAAVARIITSTAGARRRRPRTPSRSARVARRKTTARGGATACAPLGSAILTPEPGAAVEIPHGPPRHRKLGDLPFRDGQGGRH